MPGSRDDDHIDQLIAEQHATTIDELAEACRSLPGTIFALHDNGVPAPQVGLLHSAIVDAMVRRAIALRSDRTLADLRHSWVLLGSLARREPLPRSDLDTALVWADSGGAQAEPGSGGAEHPPRPLVCAQWSCRDCADGFAP